MNMWEVEYTDEFGAWYAALSVEDQDAIIGRVDLLEQQGPGLGRPAVDNIHRSRHPNMKELRAERSLRLLFAFDPRRTAILLVGGHKGDADNGSPKWNAWYDRYIPVADDLFDQHLEQLKQEGLA
jgi:hypothetical protein